MRSRGVTATPGGIAERASDLRRAFDRSFAEAPRRDTTVAQDVLAITVSGHRFAIRLSEIAGLFGDKKITPVPARSPTLLGIAGFRGAAVPVHDLRRLFGLPGTGLPRWLVIAAAAPIALAFDGFDGQLRLSRDAVASHEGGVARAYVHEIVRARGHARAIVDIAVVLETIAAQGERNR
jgi:chemotaxis signal transduction protein